MNVLSPIEARVLASLIEKSITSPEYYPLTLNALTAACNQKSNRDPVLQISETDVVRALNDLRDKKLAWAVSLAGSRVPKYRHGMLDVYPLTPHQLAVLCELMLRGPQTVGELRTRASRMAEFAEPGDVPAALRELAAWSESPLVAAFPRQPGQREERYGHLLCGALPAESVDREAAPEPARRTVAAENERVAALEARVAGIGDELDRLKAQFADLLKQLQ